LTAVADSERPAPDREETLLAGAETLHLEHFDPAVAPRAVLVAVHGFAAHCGLYRHVAASLRDAGIAVTGFDCRGHGRSTGRRGYAARFQHFVDDLLLVVERARRQAPRLPLYVMGHSHGATVALEAVLGAGLRPDRLVIAAPYLGLAMKVPAWKRGLSGLTARFWPTLTLGNGIRAEDISRNPEVIAKFWTDPLAHHVATPRWFVEVSAAQQRIGAAAADLTVPTLLILAGGERLVVNDVAMRLAGAAPAFVSVRRFEGLFHELFLEPEWPEVVAAIREWLTVGASPTLPPSVPVEHHGHPESPQNTGATDSSGDAPAEVPAILSPRT
jgi:alpha-beta hydrolase superfamily lysophospholipase